METHNLFNEWAAMHVLNLPLNSTLRAKTLQASKQHSIPINTMNLIVKVVSSETNLQSQKLGVKLLIEICFMSVRIRLSFILRRLIM